MVEHRLCPLRDLGVLIDPSRLRLPAPWSRARDEGRFGHFEGAQVLREQDGVRVVVNPRPLLRLEASGGAFGANELLLHGDADYAHVLGAALARVAQLSEDTRLRAMLWVQEYGHGRVSQSHSQLVVWARPPAQLLRPSSALLVEAVRGAVEAGRVVARQGELVAWAPWAPQVPFELLLAREGGGRLEPGQLDDLGALLPQLLSALEAELGPVPLTLGAELTGSLCMQIAPRLRPATGAELLSGQRAHGVFPELASRRLRAAIARRGG